MINWENYIGQIFNGKKSGKYKITKLSTYKCKDYFFKRWSDSQIVIVKSLSAKNPSNINLFTDVIDLMVKDMSFFRSNMDNDFSIFCSKNKIPSLPSQSTYESYYISLAKYIHSNDTLNDTDQLLESYFEGKREKKFVTIYERNKYLREKAIECHGLACKACGFDFEKKYGEYAKGFIHIHHKYPISKGEENKPVIPEKHLVPLCANCHAIIHRKKKC
ncbi:MAG: HNH endonuclease, partial [Bacteroidota bacterium]